MSTTHVITASQGTLNTGTGDSTFEASGVVINGGIDMRYQSDDTTGNGGGNQIVFINGGVFGSMLSTPIINPPQSAILGVHATKDRPVVENGQIVIRPINYLAMSYDHRIIDGREAVLGLVAMKEALEDPARLLFDI